MAQLIVNPVAGANSPCDGPVNEVSQNSAFATIQSSAGNQGGLEGVTGDNVVALVASSTTNQYAELHRSIFNFDTSALGAGVMISAVTFSIYIDNKNNGVGSPDLHCCGATPASTAAIPNTDFTNIGSTSYGNVTYANATVNAYADIILNASGIAKINKTGISSFGLRLSWDINNNFTGAWVSAAQSYFHGIFADNGTNKPKLTITYTNTTGPFPTHLRV